MTGGCVQVGDVDDSYQPIIIRSTRSRIGRLRGGCALRELARAPRHGDPQLQLDPLLCGQSIHNVPVLLSLIWYFWQRK